MGRNVNGIIVMSVYTSATLFFKHCLHYSEVVAPLTFNLWLAKQSNAVFNYHMI